jgi:hypothetical protein
MRARDPAKGPEKDAEAALKDLLDKGGPKIRCPKCAWEPRASDRWSCECGFCWNTFDTRGLCPACNYQWEHTMCLRCKEWSRHKDWYTR